MRILDLFCGAGGAAMGYNRAGFAVVGVDIRPQRHYPFRHIVMDALDFLMQHDLSMFDAIHASPPCQRFSQMSPLSVVQHPDLLTPARRYLNITGLPWVIENVPGAPMRPDVVLCGSMFNLGVRRHRWFETSFPVNTKPPACNHVGRVVQVNGHSGGYSTRDGLQHKLTDWRDAMDIAWMTERELSQAVPPAYTEWIGRQMLRIRQ